MSVNLYPLFLNLRGRCCVVVGGSEMGELKTRDLLDAGARVVVVSPEGTNQMSVWAASGKIQWKARVYEAGDLRGAFLVVSMADAETNARVFADAESEHIFCNAVDDIPNCSCYASAVLRRGPLQIAISTAWNSPALAQRLRAELGEQFGEQYGPWVQQLGEARRVVFQDKTISNENRRNILHEQAGAEAFEAYRTSHQRTSASQDCVRSPDGARKSS